jgi:YHS domain-containing protein
MVTIKWQLFGAVLCAAVIALGVAAPTGAEEERKGDLFTLGTCPISGKALGEEPIISLVDGREVRFCCGGCPDAFTKDKEANLAKLDEAVIKQQMEHYPLKTCLMSGEELGDKAINLVANNRLVRFCCKNCAESFVEDPTEALAKLDEAVIEAQVKSYPLTTCLVADEELGAMGDPIQRVHGNRLVQFCCAGCIKEFAKSPATYLAKLDKAKADK